jgi:hypothetical protein
VSWFRRKRASPLASLAGEWRCAGCGERHSGVMDLAAAAPEPWPHDSDREPNSAIRFDGDFLSEDFCVLEGRYFFVRAVLEIPVHGLAEKFGFGCWSTLSRANFDLYLSGFDDGRFPDCGPWSGWLSNRLEHFTDEEPLALLVYPQPGRQRPTLLVQDDSHPLAIAQHEGVTAQRLLALLHFYGHAPAA